MLRAIHPICLAALTVGVIPALAQSPWNGTWKLNQAKSHLTGETFTLTKYGNKYHFNGGSFQFDYACDGKDYPIFGGETVSCRETPTAINSVYKQNGKIIGNTNDQLDASGKSYTSTRTDLRADGGKTVTKTTYARVGHGTGMADTWRSTATSSNHVGNFTIRVDGNSMHFESAEDHLTWDGKLDGTPVAPHSPDMPSDLLFSEKSEGPDKMITEVLIRGKDIWHSEDTMSPDHKSYTEISWDPAKPNEKQTTVYEKQ